MPRQPTAQATYMNVMCLRGRPSCAITTAARIAPTPPAASTSPKSSAPPPRSFLIRNGTSTSTGPQKARSEMAAPISVPQSQACWRTKRKPSRRSASAERGSSSPRSARVARRHQRDRERRHDERARVEREGRARAKRGDGQPADRRARERHHERADELVERVRLHEHPLRDDLRHRRVERRAEECVPRPEDDREQEEVPELERPGEREHGDDGDRDSANEIGRDHDLAAGRSGR